MTARASAAPLAPIVCPACHGALTEAAVGDFHRYRCHVGHAFSPQSLHLHQEEETERARWAAARALDEGAAVSDAPGVHQQAGRHDGSTSVRVANHFTTFPCPSRIGAARAAESR